MQSWVMLALIGPFFWSVAFILVKRGFKQVNPLWSNILGSIIRPFVWLLPMYVLSKGVISWPDSYSWLVIIVSAFGLSFLFYALEKGKLALTSTLVALSPVVTILLAYIFLGERLDPINYGGAILIIISTVLLAWPDKIDKGLIKDYAWLRWGLLAALMYGMGDFLTKVSSNRIGIYNHIFFSVFAYWLVSMLFYTFDKKGRKRPSLQLSVLGLTIVGVVLLQTGSLLYFLAFGAGLASVVVVLGSIYPAITAVLARVFLKEKISLRQAVAIGLAVIGVIGVSI